MAAEILSFLGLSDVSPTVQYCFCFGFLVVAVFLIKDIVLRLLGGR